MPGLGGAGFTDKRKPLVRYNSPTPYLQVYCQEKVPTYAAFGTQAHGSRSLDAIPARKLPMRHLLDCSGDPDGQFEKWAESENEIFEDAPAKPERAYPARAEVRTVIQNLMETTYNIVVALGRTMKSDTLRQYEMEDWFRYKALRAQYFARLPGTVFGRRDATPSDWVIVHTLLTSQTFVHGLHARVSEVTIERETVDMHSLYLRIQYDSQGPTYHHPSRLLSMKERASSNLYRPFFPAGVRTVDDMFDSMTGLDLSRFERLFRPMSNMEQKFDQKVRRASGVKSKKAKVTVLRGLIHLEENGLNDVLRSVPSADSVKSIRYR